MKTSYISDLVASDATSPVTLLAWVGNKRVHKTRIFLDMHDSTGQLQAVIEKETTPDLYDLVETLSLETALQLIGRLVVREATCNVELQVDDLTIVGTASAISPSLRSRIDIFDPNLTDHLLSNRHLYIRNPKAMAVIRFRHHLKCAVHAFFQQNGFMEIDAPVLTPVPLYDDRTAIPVRVHDDEVFLTQCVGYYLESVVHAFERVYNMGPSFRAEESRSKRHLMEYWHIKAEIAFCNRDDLMKVVEELIAFIILYIKEHCHDLLTTLETQLCLDGLETPYPRISYREAVDHLRHSGFDSHFGKILGSEEEDYLAKSFSGPFWIVGIPRSIEPFPYVVDPDDLEVTMTADLIASRGYGELLGVAEKIPDLPSLLERMEEKGRLHDPTFEWVREMRKYGFVPHGGIGMGVERLGRWLLQIPHVRDVMPFPRVFGRHIYP